jgi:hypothetical protein
LFEIVDGDRHRPLICYGDHFILLACNAIYTEPAATRDENRLVDDPRCASLSGANARAMPSSQRLNRSRRTYSSDCSRTTTGRADRNRKSQCTLQPECAPDWFIGNEPRDPPRPREDEAAHGRNAYSFANDNLRLKVYNRLSLKKAAESRFPPAQTRYASRRPARTIRRSAHSASHTT